MLDLEAQFFGAFGNRCEFRLAELLAIGAMADDGLEAERLDLVDLVDRDLAADRIFLVTLLIPVSAILLGYLFLGERLASNHFVGMSLIALGLLSIDGRLYRWLLGQRRKSGATAKL